MRLQTVIFIIISKFQCLLQSIANNTRPKFVHLCLRAEPFTVKMYRLEWKEFVWSQGGSGREEVFLSSSFDPLCKGSLRKCVWMAVIPISFTWFPWKCLLSSAFCWLYLVSTNSGCAMCNQQLCPYVRVAVVEVMPLVRVMSMFEMSSSHWEGCRVSKN